MTPRSTMDLFVALQGSTAGAGRSASGSAKGGQSVSVWPLILDLPAIPPAEQVRVAVMLEAGEALTPLWLVELDCTSQSFAMTVLLACRFTVPSAAGSSPSAQILRLPL